MRVLVVTVVHHPLDARITWRQARTLADAGHEVVLMAPWDGWDVGVEVPAHVRAVAVPRASGRRRLAALRAAREAVATEAPMADLVLVHDPELLVALAGLTLPPLVWDVHEDTAAALADKAWLPGHLRGIAARGVAALERAAEHRVHLLLAEDGYQARFSRPHPVVANDTRVPDAVPPPGDGRVVYVGRISRGRGADALLALPGLLPAGARLELIGPADGDVRAELEGARDAGVLDWRGFQPNDEALRRVEGALAGLSLLRDEPNYAHSRPTKVLEYMARGVPVVTTPNAAAAALVREAACGHVVGFDDPEGAAAAITALRDEPDERAAMGARGRELVRGRYDWAVTGVRFVRQLEAWAASRESRGQGSTDGH